MTLVWLWTWNLKTIIMWKHHLCIVIYYILQLDCGDQAVQEIWGHKFFTWPCSDLDPRPSKQDGHQPPTVFYLHTKFQLQIICSSWDISWDITWWKKRYLQSHNHPHSHHPISSIWLRKNSKSGQNPGPLCNGGSKIFYRLNVTKLTASKLWRGRVKTLIKLEKVALDGSVAHGR